ncbi:cytochrome c [Ensifer sp. BR816]|uniref:cytochrome c n=1 Tax=Rhizobium sp. (strain BR816) TaxID=1057002 RepID=UPI00035C8D08|nr:cytochrome c [Ensifer sp. BR816]
MGPTAVKMFGLILLASAGAAGTAAQGLQSDNVSQRQQGMKAMAAAAKTINAMFKGSSAYDAKAFKAAAETIGSHSGEGMSSLFSGSVTAPGSKASASIEAEREQFNKLAADLGGYATALSAAADRNPDALSPQMRMQGGDTMMGGPLARKPQAARDVASMPAEHAFHLMLQTCTSCHAKFRTKNE